MALILVKFGIDHPIEKLKIQSAKKEDAIVFIQDGVYWNFENLSELTEGKTYLIKEDFLARGYSEEDANANLIDYHEFIDLVEKDPKFIG